MQLCTGNPLEEWERDILSDALGSSGARQYSRPIQGEEGGITVVMELPKNALDAFEALLGSRSFKLRPCLARQIAGDPPPEAQRMQVAYDLLYSTLIDCSARGLTKEQEDALWRLIDLKDLVISAEELPGGGVGISLQVSVAGNVCLALTTCLTHSPSSPHGPSSPSPPLPSLPSSTHLRSVSVCIR